MKTFAQEWKDDVSLVYPEGAPARQLYELERTFYSGAFVVLRMFDEMGSDKHSQEQAEDLLSALRNDVMSRLDEFLAHAHAVADAAKINLRHRPGRRR